MRNLLLSASLLATALVGSGCASHDTAKFDASQSLATTSRFDADYSSEQAGRNSASWGDKYTAANLFFQADTADNSILNRFNLATAYASIGETDLASGMYESLIVDGYWTRLSEDTRQGAPLQTQTFNVSQESQKRLLALEALPPGPTGATGEVGTGYTNEEALVLDQNAEIERARSSVQAGNND
jgi:hypothetical protein